MENKIKGTKDYFGIDSQKIFLVIEILESISKKYNLNKVITPTFENTSLFTKAVGNDADVVNKEMYTFKDKKDRSISLKPEGTAPIVRMVLENNLLENNNKPEFYYISPTFRYERPQKGRQREFFQYGIEKFGNDSIYTDIETIILAKEILDKLEISKYELQINSIGDSETRQKYNLALKEFINPILNELSEYAQEKVNSGNIIRVFDSKDDSDLKLLENAPMIKEYISLESKKRFEEIKEILNNNNIKFLENKNLVRGLDYYNDLVFEFISTDIEKLGSKATIIGGGRYDFLINKMDNSKNSPAIGFGLGIERLILAADDYLLKNIKNEIEYFIACAYEEKEMQNIALELSIKLRNRGISVYVDYSNKKIEKKIDSAIKMKVKKIIIVGNEINKGFVTLKNLENNTKEEKKIGEI